eukprot:TCONS_00001941-protein
MGCLLGLRNRFSKLIGRLRNRRNNQPPVEETTSNKAVNLCININNNTNYIDGLTIQYNDGETEKRLLKLEETEFTSNDQFTKKESRGLLAPPSFRYVDDEEPEFSNVTNAAPEGFGDYSRTPVCGVSLIPLENFPQQPSFEHNRSCQANDVIPSAKQPIESLADCNAMDVSVPQLGDIELDQQTLSVASSLFMDAYLEILSQHLQEEPVCARSDVSPPMESLPRKHGDDNVAKIANMVEEIVESNGQDVHFYQAESDTVEEETIVVGRIADNLKASCEAAIPDLLTENETSIDGNILITKRKNEAVESDHETELSSDSEGLDNIKNEDVRLVPRPKKRRNRTKRGKSKPYERTQQVNDHVSTKKISTDSRPNMATVFAQDTSENQTTPSTKNEGKRPRTEKEKKAERQNAIRYRFNIKLNEKVKALERQLQDSSMQLEKDCMRQPIQANVDKLVSLLFQQDKDDDEIFKHACRMISNFISEIRFGDLDEPTMAAKKKLFETMIMPAIRKKHPEMASQLATAFQVNYVKHHMTENGDWLASIRKFYRDEFLK